MRQNVMIWLHDHFLSSCCSNVHGEEEGGGYIAFVVCDRLLPHITFTNSFHFNHTSFELSFSSDQPHANLVCLSLPAPVAVHCVGRRPTTAARRLLLTARPWWPSGSPPKVRLSGRCRLGVASPSLNTCLLAPLGFLTAYGGVLHPSHHHRPFAQRLLTWPTFLCLQLASCPVSQHQSQLTGQFCSPLSAGSMHGPLGERSRIQQKSVRPLAM